MNRLVSSVVVLVLGVATGSGASLATRLLVPPPPAPAVAAAVPEPLDVKRVFVPVGSVKAPIVFDDGRLAGYVAFTVAVEVSELKQQAVADNLPLLLNAINMRTYRTPMARSTDGRIPDVEVFRKLVADAALDAFGASAVKRVLITDVTGGA